MTTPPTLRPCYVAHHPQDPSCISFNINQLIDVYKLGIKYYSPLFIVMTAAKRKRLDFQALRSALTNVIRTTSFVAAIGPMCTTLACMFNRLLGRHYRLVYFCIGFATSYVALYIEHVARRKEVTLYMASVCLEMLWRMGQARGIVSSIPHGEVLVFAFAMSALLYFYRQRQDCLGNAKFILDHTVGQERQKDLIEKTLDQVMHPGAANNALAGFAKGFILGFLLKGAHGLLFKVLKGKRANVLGDSVNLGLFFGLMISAARGVESLLKKFKVPNAVSSATAGFVAGLSSICFPSVDVALYAFVKAGDAIVTALNKSGALPKIPHGLQLLFASEMALAYYAVCFENPTVRRSFWNFLQSICGGRLKPYSEWYGDVCRELGVPMLDPKFVR